MRAAHVFIYVVRVVCPHCENPVMTDENDHPNECVGIEAGPRNCSDCGKRFNVPNLSSLFGERIIPRRRRRK